MRWVVSRALCRYRFFDLKTIPVNNRPQALELQLQQWSPFMRRGQYGVWTDDGAMVWCWDAERVAMDAASQSLNPKKMTLVPEPLMQPRQVDGLFLVRGLDGVEGQFWREQVLADCRWWAEAPSEAEWRNFQRDAGVMPEQQQVAVPAPLVPEELTAPWAKSAQLGFAGSSSQQLEGAVVFMAVLGLVGVTAWYGSTWLHTRQAMELRQAELKKAEQQSVPNREARQQALAALARIRTVQNIDIYPQQMEVMARIANSLPKDGTYLTEWDYQNGQLKISVASPNKINQGDLIKSLQDAGVVTGVRAVPGGAAGVLTVGMEVLRKEQTASLPALASASTSTGASASPVAAPASVTTNKISPLTPSTTKKLP